MEKNEEKLKKNVSNTKLKPINHDNIFSIRLDRDMSLSQYIFMDIETQHYSSAKILII